MQRPRLTTSLLTLLYGCAGLQFVRYYVQSTTFYLNLPRYLAGQERLPFQQRVLPILLLKPLTESTWVHTHLAHSSGSWTLARGPFYLLSLLSMLAVVLLTQQLYEAISPHHRLRALVFPALLFAMVGTYVLRMEANYSYPYDLPSLAFFTAGVLYIYQRRFLPLLAVVVVGSFNRETTLFLVALYVIDAVLGDQVPSFAALQPARLRQELPWARAALLAGVWIAIKLVLAHRFHGNDTSESFLRVHDNLRELKPRLVPALLNICGYTLPIVLVLQHWLRPRRFRNYLWVLPLWFAVMFCSGVLLETRIYGELCSLSAVALVLIAENYVSDSTEAAAALGASIPSNSLTGTSL